MASQAKAPLPVRGGLDKADEDQVDAAAAALRGCFPQGFQEGLFVGSEEDVGSTHWKALKAWFQFEGMPAAKARKAWGAAFPSLSKAIVKSVLVKIQSVKTYVLRKQRNAKTGERMEAWVKELLAVLQSSEGGLCRVKATETGKNVGNVKRKSESSGSKPSKVSKVDSPSPEMEIGHCLSDAESHVSIPSTAVSTQVASLSGVLHKDSEMHTQKKPAMKKPAKAPLVAKLGSWKESPSFGFVKPTYAKEKSYIQSRQTMRDKFSLLVNVQGVDHHAHVCEQLLTFVCATTGLDKAKVISKRSELLG